MIDLKELWRVRREKQRELDAAFPTGFLYVKPLENRVANTTNGLACGVSCEQAARLILAGGHRIATDEEIAEAVEHGQRQLRASDAQENRLAHKLVLELRVDQRPASGRKAVKE